MALVRSSEEDVYYRIDSMTVVVEKEVSDLVSSMEKCMMAVMRCW